MKKSINHLINNIKNIRRRNQIRCYFLISY